MSRRRCAIYTRKSTDEGLDQDFNSLEAQHESCVAFIGSQKHEGWQAINARYDDGGFSGGSMDRPGLQRLLADVAAQKVDIIVVYKIDRLTRSLADFAKMVELFDAQQVSFVSVTQQFNTTTSMVDAVWCEPVSGEIPCYTGKIQGIFSNLPNIWSIRLSESQDFRGF